MTGDSWCGKLVYKQLFMCRHSCASVVCPSRFTIELIRYQSTIKREAKIPEIRRCRLHIDCRRSSRYEERSKQDDPEESHTPVSVVLPAISSCFCWSTAVAREGSTRAHFVLTPALSPSKHDAQCRYHILKSDRRSS